MGQGDLRLTYPLRVSFLSFLTLRTDVVEDKEDMIEKRKIIQISADRSGVYALADDGTLWYSLNSTGFHEGNEWDELVGLPDKE